MDTGMVDKLRMRAAALVNRFGSVDWFQLTGTSMESVAPDPTRHKCKQMHASECAFTLCPESLPTSLKQRSTGIA